MEGGERMLKVATKLAPEWDNLEAAYRAGFRHAELWLDGPLLEDWQAILQRTSRYPLRYAMHFPNRPQVTPEGLRGCVELYRALECPALVIHPPMYEHYGSELLRLDPNLVLAVENGNLSAERLADWAEQSPYLTLDLEHVWMFSYREARLPELVGRVHSFLERWGDKVRHVHLPGYWPGCRTHRPMYCGRDFVFAMLTALAERRFDGFIVAEADAEYQNPVELQMDVLLFEAWRQRHDPQLLA
jgi:hypothetical protein